jgi:lipoate---protein ligase
MKPWRVIYWPEASPIDYIVTRPLVNDLRTEGKIPDTLLIYSVNRDFVAVGRHINVDDDINLEACTRLGVEIFRKIGGGGSGIWGPNSFQFAFAFGQNIFPSMEEALRIICNDVLLRAIHRMGVTKAHYKHIGDLLVGTRKLAALAALPHGDTCVNMGGFLNIEDLNVSIASAVLKTPEEKFSDKVAKDIRDYATSLQREAGGEISRKQCAEVIVEELERALDTKAELAKLSEMEMGLFDGYRERYASDKWTFAKSDLRRFASIPEGYGLALNRHKARKLVCAHVLVNRDGRIADVMLSGDYFITPSDGDDRIAADLVGLDAMDTEAIKRRIREVAANMSFEAMMMNIEDFSIPVIEACRRAIEKMPLRKRSG